MKCSLTYPLLIALAGCGAVTPASRPSPEEAAVARMQPCPSSPNCVCSREDPADATHYIEPLRFTGGADQAMARLRQIVEDWDRAEVIEADGGYLRAVFTTRLLRFKDDVEFELDAEAGLIHVRSASRLGHSDLGANRKRVEAIRAAFG